MIGNAVDGVSMLVFERDLALAEARRAAAKARRLEELLELAKIKPGRSAWGCVVDAAIALVDVDSEDDRAYEACDTRLRYWVLEYLLALLAGGGGGEYRERVRQALISAGR